MPRSPSPPKHNRGSDRERHRKKHSHNRDKSPLKHSKKRASSDEDDETMKKVKIVHDIQSVKERMRQQLNAAVSGDKIKAEVIDITDDTVHGPMSDPRTSMRTLEKVRCMDDARKIDAGDAFRPATFRSSRKDKQQGGSIAVATNVVEAHEHAIFGAKTEPMDQTVEGPLLRHQRHIDDNSNATTVSTTLTDKYGDAALLMPDFLFVDKTKRQQEWLAMWKQIRGKSQGVTTR